MTKLGHVCFRLVWWFQCIRVRKHTSHWLASLYPSQTNPHLPSRCTSCTVFPETHLKTDQTMTDMSPLFNCSPLRATALENINRNTCGWGVMCIPLLLRLPRAHSCREDTEDRTVNTGFSHSSHSLHVSTVGRGEEWEMAFFVGASSRKPYNNKESNSTTVLSQSSEITGPQIWDTLQKWWIKPLQVDLENMEIKEEAYNQWQHTKVVKKNIWDIISSVFSTVSRFCTG